MKKTIVIPTDFTVKSLNVLKTVLNQNHNKEVLDVILLHSLSLTDSIRDLLFFSKHEQINALMNPEFEEAYEVIRNKFDSQISSLRIDLFTGYNLSAFNSYLEANKVEQIFVSAYQTEKAFDGLDWIRFIDKCAVEVTRIDLATSQSVPENGKFAEVFVNQVSLG